MRQMLPISFVVDIEGFVFAQTVKHKARGINSSVPWHKKQKCRHPQTCPYFQKT